MQKTTWTAHTKFLTCLRAATDQVQLLSGSQTGEICFWDMRTPPSNATIELLYHTRLVTDLQLQNSHTLYSSSADGSVLHWDLRSTKVCHSNDLLMNGHAVQSQVGLLKSGGSPQPEKAVAMEGYHAALLAG